MDNTAPTVKHYSKIVGIPMTPDMADQFKSISSDRGVPRAQLMRTILSDWLIQESRPAES